ncbi:MAG: ATP-binding cassette domain-containing protein [Sorangiineae bacterium]|nr:ATP-binding cassette domain-containing protein [Polyangiaceae bacterium]MEB2321026.1 ATP-binding cassette domain-containing protein [Sorangiineae bacterium]
MISAHEVSMNYGERVLFDNVSVTFNDAERYGLTGPNGAGKSTFMKILDGSQEPSGGRVSARGRLGVLRQDHSIYVNDRILDVVLMGNPRLWEALSEKERLLAKGDELSDDDGIRLGELEMVIAEEDGYTAESEAAGLLLGLDIPEDVHEEKLEVLQGGDRVRVLLAQALFGKPDTLLLDEPTNSLDIASIRWLESFLLAYTGALVVISHDRHFLNEVCTRIADVDYETIIVYPGNYDDMVRLKADARSSLELANAAKQQKVTQLQEFVQRFRSGSRASQVKSREKQIEREKQAMLDLKRSNIQRPFIRFEQARPSGRNVLSVVGLDKSFGDKTICKGFNLSVMRGDKIALVGPNGIGKTTLLRLLDEELAPDAGKIDWGYEANRAYMPQEHGELIEKSDKTMRDWLWDFNTKVDEERLRALFGKLLFKKDDPLKQTRVLSGGETVRLILAKLMLAAPNVLLLDEPTNHLDLESIRSLTEALAVYQGTAIFVTHDRNMVDQVATRVLEMSPDGIRELSPDAFREGQFLVKHGLYQAAVGY